MSIPLTIELICPVCGTQFTSTSIVATDRIGQDTDFRPRSRGTDPVPHNVHLCPDCCFSAFQGDFDSVPEPVREYVLSGVVRHLPLWADDSPRTVSGSAKYLIAAQCYEHDLRATELRLGDLYLRASWCARQENNHRRERECQIGAALRFEQALADSEVGQAQRATILYLVGELYRRLGHHELAVAVLEEAEVVCSGKTETRLIGLIHRQRQAAVQQDSQNMVMED